MITIFKRIFFIGLAVFITLLLILLIPLPYDNNLGLILNKSKILQESFKQEKPSIIFIGGSSVLVGIDGEMIKKELGYNPVNLGVFAGFPVSYLLSLTVKYIRKNDVIVITPEYSVLTNYNNIVGVTKKWALITDPLTACKNLYNFPSDIPAFFLDMFSICQEKMLGTIKYLIKYRKIKFIYGIDTRTINQYGDAKVDFFKKIDVESLKKQYEAIDSIRFPDFVSSMNSSLKPITEKGAKVYFIYPPYPQQHFNQSKTRLLQIDSLLRMDNKITILGVQNDFLYEYNCFTNSPNHLSEECREIRTSKIIELIKNCNK